MVGRNDACPCGSGVKYKRCCAGGESLAPPSPGRPAGGPLIAGADLEGMRAACRLAARVRDEACAQVAPGITTNQVNDLVLELTLAAGAYPAPLNYPHPRTDPRVPIIAPHAFPKSVCTSINDVVCHGIPDGTVLVEGDIVNVDVTCLLDGWYGDTSRTMYVGQVSDEARRLTDTTRECLDVAITTVRDGALFWDIGDAIQELAESRGFSVVRNFTGHGIGRAFHEPPAVLHYRDKSMRFPMRTGQCFTIEPMINAGHHRVVISARDGWTARTADGSLSAQFEHTLLVTDDGCEVLTAP